MRDTRRPSKNQLTRGPLNNSNPVFSVLYNVSGKPREIVYNLLHGATETVTITYPGGEVRIGDVTYKGYDLNIFEATLEKRERPEVYDSITVAVTVVGTNPTRILFPETGTQFRLYHATGSGVLWLGGSDQIAVDSGSAPIPENTPWNLSVHELLEKEIWGVVSAGTIRTYVVGQGDSE